MRRDQPSGWKSAFQLALRAGITGFLLWLALRHVELRTLLQQIASIDRQAIVYALVTFSLSIFVAALRWTTILIALKNQRPVSVTYPISLIGAFFGQALPAGVGGDVVRVWLATRSGLSMRFAVSGILGDRLTGFLSILVIVTLELPQLRALFHSSALFGGLLVVMIGGYCGLTIFMLLDKLPQSLQRFKIARGFSAVSSDVRSALFSSFGPIVLAFGAAIQLLNVLVVFLLARGLHSPTSFFDCLLIVPFANVLQTVPVSIAGWGVRESFFVTAFGLIGVAAPSALAISVLFGLLFLASSLPGGVLWLLQGTGSPLKLREAIKP